MSRNGYFPTVGAVRSGHRGSKSIGGIGSNVVDKSVLLTFFSLFTFLLNRMPLHTFAKSEEVHSIASSSHFLTGTVLINDPLGTG